MAHSKRNTTRAFFTAHERAELKGHWGSSSTRLTRESFLPFGSCNLCLLQARDPVSCSDQGHIFCRECAISNLLAQSKEIKRLKKDAERRKAEEDDEKELEDADAQLKDLESFERTQAGLPNSQRSTATGQKRKSIAELDEVVRNTKRQALDRPKDDTSFWIPSQTHGAKHEQVKITKQHPTCPITTKPHEFSLKTLVNVQFHEQESTSDQSKVRSCPSCSKALSNTTKGMLARPCGHVLCKSCSDKFQKPSEKSAHDSDADEKTRCYVCQENITPREVKADKPTKNDRGLTELKSDGTGFAGGGDSMVKREGLAFQFG